MRKILDPETYRPYSLVTRKSPNACDLATGDVIFVYDEPDERAIAHANKLSLEDRAHYDIGLVEQEFWRLFCNPSLESNWDGANRRWADFCRGHPKTPVLLVLKNGEWRKAMFGHWETARGHLWKLIIAEDLRREDHGPKRWYAWGHCQIRNGLPLAGRVASRAA